MKRFLSIVISAQLALLATGCFNSQPRPLMQSQPYPPPSPRPVLQAGPMTAPPPGFQPTPFPVAPPQAAPAPQFSPAPAPQYSPQVSPFPVVPPPATPNVPPPNAGAASPQANPITRVENRWQPGENAVQLGAPEPLANANPRAPLRLYPPERSEPPLMESTTALPVGIPHFAMAADNVATGLRPLLDDGLDWLKARGYRTVVQVHLPGENDSPDRKQVEKRGMKYVSLEVSPQTLNKTIVDEFTRIVRDISGQPVYIYDRDGSLAGGLWYLHFRMAEQFSDDVARIRAGSLGLRENRDGAERDMWLAIQKYLNETSR